MIRVTVDRFYIKERDLTVHGATFKGWVLYDREREFKRMIFIEKRSAFDVKYALDALYEDAQEELKHSNAQIRLNYDPRIIKTTTNEQAEHRHREMG